jgi:hypothetical protein
LQYDSVLTVCSKDNGHAILRCSVKLQLYYGKVVNEKLRIDCLFLNKLHKVVAHRAERVSATVLKFSLLCILCRKDEN